MRQAGFLTRGPENARGGFSLRAIAHGMRHAINLVGVPGVVAAAKAQGGPDKHDQRLIDGPMAPLPCLSQRHYARCEDCTDEETCRIRRVFAEVFWSYLVLIESLTLADLVRSPGAAAQVFAA